ncbi:MAG: diguanylate cyclase, partial [Planktomarina sp.]
MTGQIYIITSDRHMCQDLCRILRQALYRVTWVSSALQLSNQNDRVLACIIGPEQSIDDLSTLKRKLTNGQGGDCPPIFQYTFHNDRKQRVTLIQNGIQDVLQLPIAEEILKAKLANILRKKAQLQELNARSLTAQSLGFCEPPSIFKRRSRIMLVSNQPEKAFEWKTILARNSPHEFKSASPEMALSDTGFTPDLFVVDGTEQGLNCLRQLRSTPRLTNAATLMVTEAKDTSWAMRGVDLGVGDIVIDGFEPIEALLRIDRLLRDKLLIDRLQMSVQSGLRASITDPLTGLYNRRYALPYLNRLESTSKADDTTFALMMLDIDHFKTINDTHGHIIGDAILVAFANRIISNLRTVDLFARIGGEEFLVALPNTTPISAQTTAERIRTLITNTPYEVEGVSSQIDLTVSIGMTFGGTGKSILPAEEFDTANNPTNLT